MRNMNSAEVALIMSELPLEGSLLEDIREHDFSDLTFTFYTKTGERIHLFVSLTAPVRIYRVDGKGKSTEKLQRFIQFARARVFPSRVKSVTVVNGEREIKFALGVSGEEKFLYLRLFSGSRANLIVTDCDNTIEEAFFRRPAEHMVKGEKFIPSLPKNDMEFDVWPRMEGMTFNEQLRKEFEEDSSCSSSAEYARMLLSKHFEIYKGRLEGKIKSVRIHLEKTDIEVLQSEADTLSWNSTDGKAINEAYAKVKEAKRIFNGEKEHLARLEAELAELSARYNEVIADGADTGIKTLDSEIYRKISKKEAGTSTYPVPAFKSSGWIVFCARNARENDLLMRSLARGNDMWLHVRSSTGGYVIIKSQSGKTVPLSVLLDACELALYYSSLRGSPAADLHKTFVKYVKRIKGGKLGLVEVVRDESFFFRSDEKRLENILKSSLQ